MKLRHKFTIPIILASLVLAFAFMVFFIYWSQMEVENKLSRSFYLRNFHITNQINRHFQARISNLEDVGEYAEKKFKKVPLKALTNKFYEFRNLQKVFQNIKLYDMKGKKLIDTNGIRVNRVFELQKLTPQGSQIQTSYFYNEDPETRIKVISFSKFIFDKEQNPVALIVADLPIASVRNLVHSLIEETHVEDGLALELLRENGEIIYSNYSEGFSAAKTIETSIKAGLSKKLEYIFFQDEGSFYSVSKSIQANASRVANHYLVIKLNKDIAFRSIADGTRILVLITVVIIVVFLFVSYQLVSRLTLPIESASRALAEIGNGNFAPILDVKISDDEYGELVASLQVMTQKVDLLIKEQVSEYRLASLGNMASNIAHEINNPLHLINNHAISLKKMITRESIIIKDEVDAEKIKRSLNAVTDTVLRISKIIVGMKALSRDGANDQFDVCELSSILDGTLTLCEASLKSREIKLQINRPSSDFTLECRSVQIQQVLLNLINNAADAIAAQNDKWIEINVSENEDEVRFEIVNSGEKISREIASNIFTPFYTTKSQGRGTGLGLSISKSIIDDHHGMLDLDLSNAHTCFMFRIPKTQKINNVEPEIAA